jgi:hypothetical protein
MVEHKMAAVVVSVSQGQQEEAQKAEHAQLDVQHPQCCCNCGYL